MEGRYRADRTCAVAAAAAHDFNDELTIIYNSVCESLALLEPGHPARRLLIDARSSAQRCAWKAAVLLNYSARQGLRPGRTSLEALLL